MGSRVDGEEILQETFVRAYESIDRFRWLGESSFFRWLCGIAKHVLLQSIDRARDCESIDDAHEAPFGATTPSRHLRREERFERLVESLASLSADYRDVIYMARIEGLTTKDIAQRMGRSPNAVSHLIARALAELKSRFGDTESLHLPQRSLLQERGEDGE